MASGTTCDHCGFVLLASQTEAPDYCPSCGFKLVMAPSCRDADALENRTFRAGNSPIAPQLRKPARTPTPSSQAVEQSHQLVTSTSPAALGGRLPIQQSIWRRKVRVIALLALVAATGGGLWLVGWSHADLNGVKAPGSRGGSAEGSLPTLDQIQELLDRKDPEIALEQARAWERLFQDVDVSPEDPRRNRLHQVIAQLEALTRSGSQIEVFRRRVAELMGLVKRGDYVRARTTVEQLDQMLLDHSDTLESHAMVYAMARQYFLHEESRYVLPNQVHNLLDRALEQAADGQAILAWECRAQARALSWFIYADEGAVQKLRVKVEKVDLALRRASAQRAVAEAREARLLGDWQTMTRLVDLARSEVSLLPREERPQLLAMIETVRADASLMINQGRSALAGQIAAREDYEGALAKFAAFQRKPELADWCAAGIDLASLAALQGNENSDWAENLASLALESLKRSFEFMSEPAEDESDKTSLESEQAQVIAAVRVCLERFSEWRTQDEWTSLDAFVRYRGAVAARRLIEEAQKAETENRVEEAYPMLELVERIGADAQVREAQRLRTEWRAEHLALSEDRARREAIAAIQQQMAAGLWVLAQSTLNKAESLFQTSPDRAELNAMRDQIAAGLRQSLPNLLMEARECAEKPDHVGLREKVAHILAIPGVDPTIVAPWQLQLDAVDAEADRIFEGLDPKAESANDLTALMLGLNQVLTRNPEHAGAIRLREQTRISAQEMAGTMLAAIEREMALGVETDAQRSKLERQVARVIELAADGPIAERARTILSQIRAPDETER